jgi:(1->4)-alpha-D-glucan 1-alpha-D-glucosylmutase
MRIPTATYRLQFRSEFGFRAAEAVVPYLEKLGITHIYASPIFKARAGSPHGYDVVDPGQMDPALGTTADFQRLHGALKAAKMGWIQDIVPNHMALSHENPMITDLFENGPASPYYNFFDILWDHPYPSLQNRLLAPFLGRFYGEALESKEIQITYGPNGFSIRYFEHEFPIKIDTYLPLLTRRMESLTSKLGEEDPDYIKYLGTLYVLKGLATVTDRELRTGHIRFIKRVLWELYSRNGQLRTLIDQNVEAFNGVAGHPESFRDLEALLADQVFRLSFWKVAAEEINYRRFFNINELVSVRVEDERVFEETHSFVFDLVARGLIDGLRVDHIDGLYDPAGYLKRLRERTGDRFIVVEKILDHDERLPEVWPVQGTTGYDFLNHVNNIFCQTKQRKAFDRIYTAFTLQESGYDELVANKKRLIIGRHMAGDIDNLAHLLKTISSSDRHASDITLYGLRRALVEVMAQFPVYRTYINRQGISDDDRMTLERAIERARRSIPGLANEIGFIERFLMLKFDDYLSETEKAQWVHFAMRFQQFTGPLMAKGFEDTTLYVYNRLLSLNEVGGDPARFGTSLPTFHAFNLRRAEKWPNTMNSTATHDTKRGEDVRARINVLSEIPREWEAQLKTWQRLNRNKKSVVQGVRVPDRNDEYFLYQTLIGTFPLDPARIPSFTARLKNYLVKAVREAKVSTGWLKPDEDYENGYLTFVERLLKPATADPFLESFLAFQKRIGFYGMLNGLSQTLLKLTAPGVPDFYQGTELWDLTFVDPDNRRPVNFPRLARLLEDLIREAKKDLSGLLEDLVGKMEDGRIKLFLIYQSLQVRKAHAALFAKGGYLAIEAEGERKGHVAAFARKLSGKWSITIAPLFLTSVIAEGELPVGEAVWGDTFLPLPPDAPENWRNAITGERIHVHQNLRMAEALSSFPVSLLVSEDKS